MVSEERTGFGHRDIQGTHQSYMTKNHLQYYLDEFVFRHNRRKSKSRGLLFYALIKQAVIDNLLNIMNWLKAYKY
jgi:hypothetical protein